MLDSHSRALQQKVECGETIASASGQRDHQIVEQPRSHEYQEARRLSAQNSMQPSKDQLMGKLAEPRFHRFPQNSPRDVEPNGADMMGSALTPTLCQRSATI